MMRPCLSCGIPTQNGSRCRPCARAQRRFNSTEWLAARSIAIKRDRGPCVVCGGTDHLHAHHRTRYADAPSNDVAGLVTLCSSCHRRVEAGSLQLPKRDAA